MALARRAISRAWLRSSSRTSRSGRLRRRSGAPSPVAGLGRLDSRGTVVRLPQLLRRRPHRRCGAVFPQIVLNEPPAEIVARALGKHFAGHQSCSRARTAREIAEPESEPGAVEVIRRSAPQEDVELAQPPILAAIVAEVLPRVEPRRDDLRGRDRDALVDDELAQRGARSQLPAVIVAA